jgi:GH35 family endo-1,4-beta-xylanase
MAPNCESFETWGFTDKVSWLKEPKNALPFDKNFKKKSSYHAMGWLL